MEPIIKAAAYGRVSTLLGQDTTHQITPIREFCRSRGFNLTSEREFCDTGISGVKERRPALDKMLQQARLGKFHVLVVAGLDRCSRNVRHLLALLDELNSVGVKFISLREAIDLSTPQGQMTMTVLAAVAQLERDLTRQRVRETLAAKKLLAQQTGNGWRCGRPIKTNDDAINEVLSLRGRGHSIREIERMMDRRLSRGSIGRILQAHGASETTCPTNPENFKRANA